MHKANIMLALGGDAGNSVPKYDVTPAEVAVLRHIHGDESVTDIEPTGEIDRTSRVERTRLSETYGRRGEHGRHIAPAVDALFPGAAARVFETFDELDLPEEFYKADSRMKSTPRVARVAAAPAPEPEKSQVALKDLTVQQLREFATVNRIDLGDATKKAAIIAVIEKAEAAAKASADVDADEGDDEDGIDDINDEHASGDTNLFT